jgi:stage V sporulation protein R
MTHKHRGVDLRMDYAHAAMASLVRIWKRPVCLRTAIDSKPTMLRFDGREHTSVQEAG